MLSIGLINLGILPLLLEAMTPAYAQHDQREQDSRRQAQEAKAKQPRPSRPERPEQPQREARPQREPRPERAPPRKLQDRPEPRADRPPTPGGRAEQGQRLPAEGPRPRPHPQQRPESQHQSAWPSRRARDWKAEHRTWQDRGGYRGYRIPDHRFHGSFGPSHGFRMSRFPLIVIGGFPRFQFNGFWFSVMDPWPEYWSETWYGDDDLYIEYWDGGYYLLNRRHAMDRIAITVMVR
ncbi:MAG: hypothetical protein KA743_11335 [Geothrix sp.]|nr:hypothetical protein [Geothrix sp.]